jgi:aldose 1-epimerase
MNPRLTSRDFGTLATGETVEAWTLSGPSGLTVEAMTYGGIVRSILAPGRSGELADVALGFNTLEEYVAGHPYFGSIVGRVAGRITDARFEYEDETFHLSSNETPNHLHGGFTGFDKKLWTALPIERADGMPSIRLSTTSADGEEGYPGNVQVSVTYSVLEDNTFLIESEAVSDRPTPLSLTNHSYFNLAGEGSGPALDHSVQIHADEFVPTGEHLALIDKLMSLSGSSEDLRQPMTLGSALATLTYPNGSLCKVRRSRHRSQRDAWNDELVPVARLVHSGSGRALDVSTTEEFMQFYTGAWLDGMQRGKSNVAYMPYQGVCFECEGYANGANAPQLGNIFLLPGETQRRKTSYRFSVVESPASA